MKTAKLMYWTTAALIYVSPLLAQVNLLPEKEIAHLDSLMYAGNFKAVQTFFSMKEAITLAAGTDARNAYQETKKSYLNIIEHVHRLQQTGSTRLQARIMHFKKQANLFGQELAGRRASDAFRNFMKMADSDELAEAAKFYYIAYFFRVKYIKAVFQKIRAEIRSAYSFLNRGHIHKAKQISDAISIPTDHNVYLSSMDDSLANLQTKIEAALELKEKRDWSKDQPVKVHAVLAFGGTVFHKNSVNDGHLFFNGKDNIPDENIDFVRVPGNFAAGFNLMGQYYLAGSFLAGADFSYHRLHYDSSSMRELTFFNFYLRQISAHIYLGYVFRSRTGVRPYAGVGAGILRSTRNRSDAAILFKSEDSDTVFLLKSYFIESSTMTTARMLFRFGLEYIPRKLRYVVFGGHFSIYHNFQTDDFVKSVNYSIGLSAGLVL